MSKLNQKEAVYVATMNVLAEAGIGFDDYQPKPVSELVSKSMRSAITMLVAQGIVDGQVEFSESAKTTYPDLDSVQKKYVPGLVSNWFRKDKRMNGGVDYEAKNPGSRAGSQDETIKSLKALREQQKGNAEAVQLIDEAIAKRIAEIKPKKTVELTEEMIARIPEELRAKLGL